MAIHVSKTAADARPNGTGTFGILGKDTAVPLRVPWSIAHTPGMRGRRFRSDQSTGNSMSASALCFTPRRGQLLNLLDRTTHRLRAALGHFRPGEPSR